jgi:hypothetical protein
MWTVALAWCRRRASLRCSTTAPQPPASNRLSGCKQPWSQTPRRSRKRCSRLDYGAHARRFGVGLACHVYALREPVLKAALFMRRLVKLPPIIGRAGGLLVLRAALLRLQTHHHRCEIPSDKACSGLELEVPTPK